MNNQRYTTSSATTNNNLQTSRQQQASVNQNYLSNDPSVVAVLTGNDILRRTNERLARTEVVCQESEAIATDTLDELANQRESLTRTRGGLQGANEQLSQTHSNLKSIYINLSTNKLLLMAIILAELVIIGCQVYIKFFKNRKS